MSKSLCPPASTKQTPVFWEQSVRHNDETFGMGRILAISQLRTNRGLSEYRRLNSYALVYLIAGSGRYESPLAGMHELKPGDAILVFPGDPHRYQPAPKSGWQELYVLFEGKIFDLWRDEGLLVPKRPILHGSPVGKWSAKILDLLPKGRIRLTKAQSLKAVLTLQCLLAELIHGREPQRFSTEEAWIEQAMTALRMLPYPGLESIAHPFGLSADAFRKRFRAIRGKTVSDYRQRYLLAKAQALLTEGRLRHHEIADALGFHDAAHFSKWFKNNAGSTPSDFRE